jgi:hypothetical protein
MKNSLGLAIVMVVLGSCAIPQSHPQEKDPPAQGASGGHEKALFLHLLEAGAETDPRLPAHRIVTTRVYPFQDFSVSVGHPENPFTKPSWDGAFTSPIWSKDGSPEARPLAALWNSGDATLAGRIQTQNGKFLARLQGRNRTTLNYFAGEMELEKPVYEHGGYYHGGALWGVWFVLSTNADCGSFLKALENGQIRRPDVVDRDSPLAKRWVEGKSKPEPDSPANQGSPSRETNRPPAAAGPGR